MKKNKRIKFVRIAFSVSFLFMIIFSAKLMAQAEIEAKKMNGKTPSRMDSIIQFHETIIKEWAKSPELIEAVKEQNSKGISIEEIKKIDKDWIAGGIDGKNNDFSMELQSNKAGAYLRGKIKANGYLYIEAFLCDSQGAVVGEYPKTSDYWQGDEDKFTKCFNNGDGKTYIGPIIFDESTKTISVQISVPVLDEGKTIGVLVVGLRNIE